jgi:hypothetical protein
MNKTLQNSLKMVLSGYSIAKLETPYNYKQVCDRQLWYKVTQWAIIIHNTQISYSQIARSASNQPFLVALYATN